MKKVYISLPITGRERAAREKASAIENLLRELGYEPVNPFRVYAGKKPCYADYLCADLRALADCDAILLCDGWMESRGCRVERAFALEMGVEVKFEDNFFM